MKKIGVIGCVILMLLSLLSFQPGFTFAAEANSKPQVIPSLQEWTGGTGTFMMEKNSRIVVDSVYYDQLMKTANVFKKDLKEVTGYDLEVKKDNSSSAGDFFLTLNSVQDESIGDEGYLFEVNDSVKITANTITGVFYGTRTALQILVQNPQKNTIVKGIAKDYPKYKVRGFMLDVGRKFFPMDFLRDYVKMMSWYKMNDFQIHLSDNAIFKDNSREHWNEYSAFRLESETYPELTAKDGHYTKQEFRELQDLAKTYGMTITPEIDTPSHALAFTKVRPDLVHPNLPVDHLDITRPETIDFVKSVFDEYIDLFDADEIHIGADEFYAGDKATIETYRQYLNTLNQYFKSKGKKVRAWGSLSQFPGDTPVDKDITMNIWNNGWHNPISAINDGYKIINTVDSLLYMVPKAGYYYDYLNTEWLYNNWEPTYFSGSLKLKENEPNLLGGMFAVWNDLLGKKVSIADVHDRVKHAMPTLAEKMWRGKSSDAAFSQFEQANKNIGEAPGTNLLHTVQTKGDVILNYPFNEGTGSTAGDISGNQYDGRLNGIEWTDNGKSGKAVIFTKPTDHIKTNIETKGFPWTVSAWVNLKENSDSELVLLESSYGAIKLKQRDSGKAGFSREGYDFSFNTAIPAGRWVHVAFRGDLKGTSLFVDGELKDSISETTLLPVATIGSEKNSFEGTLDDLYIFDRKLTDKEIAAFSGAPWTENIAAHKPAKASSVEVDYLNPELAFDEDESRNSRWASRYSDNEWIYVDLQKTQPVGKVVLKWESAYGKGYKIQVSDDAQNWKDVYSTSTGIGGTEVIKFPAENTRYVRMLGTKRATTYGYSLYEFEVYGPNPYDPVLLPKPVHYEQNFEDGTIGGLVKTAGNGNMKIVNDPTNESKYSLRIDANNTNNIIVDQNSPIIQDGEIEFKVTPQDNKQIRTGIVFRYSNKDSWAYVGFDTNNWYWVNAQDSYGLMTSNPEAKLLNGVTSTIKIKFEGQYITLFVNGKQYFEGVLNKLPKSEGKLGIRAFGPTSAIFDNMKYKNNVADRLMVTGVQLDKNEVKMPVGKNQELVATITPADATYKNITWLSSDESIAKVEVIDGNKAKVTGMKEGTAFITVTTADGGYTATTKVTVLPKLEKITLGTDDNILLPGDQASLIISGIMSDGTKASLDEAAIEYHTDHPGIVSITNEGKLTLAKNVKDIRGFQIWADVTLEGIKVTSNRLEFKVGVNLQLIGETIKLYQERDELKHPLAVKLEARLEQAEHQKNIGNEDQAIKQMEDFLKHLNQESMETQISEVAKNLLNNDAKELIEEWTK